jgi:pilus assembly protein CpaB
MNRNRLLIGLLIAIVIAFLLSMFVYRAYKQAAAVRPAPVTQHIVVASLPLPLGTRLSEDNVRLIPWPEGEPLTGMFTRVQDCTGRALLTAVVENEAILETRLAALPSGAGLPATIPEGMRALSVAVNDVVAVAGFVQPGTMVDVLVTGSAGGGGNQNITRTILENVPVLAAGQKIEQDRDGKPQTVPVITLLVSPEDADRLTMGASQGKIQLALRNTIDTRTVSPPPVLQATLFGGAAPAATKPAVNPKAPPPPPSLYVIEVISGTKRENKSFPDTP